MERDIQTVNKTTSNKQRMQQEGTGRRATRLSNINQQSRNSATELYPCLPLANVMQQGCGVMAQLQLIESHQHINHVVNIQHGHGMLRLWSTRNKGTGQFNDVANQTIHDLFTVVQVWIDFAQTIQHIVSWNQLQYIIIEAVKDNVVT